MKAQQVRGRCRPLLALMLLALGACTSGLQAQERPGSDAPSPLSPSPAGHYLAARQAQAQRDNAAAADLLSVTLASDPKNPNLLNANFLLLAGEGRLDEAAKLAERIDAIDPASPTAGIVLAWRAVEQGDFKSADAYLAKLPDEGVNRLMVPLLRAWVQLALGNPDQGLGLLTTLEATPGMEPVAYLHRALIEDLAGRTAAADADFAKLLKAESSTLRVVQLVGNFYQRQGRKDEAKALYDAFLSATPDSIALEPDLKDLASGKAPGPIVATPVDGLAESFFNMASLLLREQIADTAMVFERIALALKPDYPIAQTLLAEMLASQGRTSDAVAVYRTIPLGSPFSWQGRIDEAQGLDELNQADAAIRMLEGMIEERPERYDAATALGNIYRSQERFEEATKAYDIAVSRLAEPTRRHWSLFYLRGITLERTKQWPRAEADFKKALELEPEQPYVMNYLAYSWLEMRQNLDEALRMLTRAVELKPNDGFIVDSLGWAYYRLGQYDKAVQYLERAVELEPIDATINDHLGDAYWRVGRKTEARYQWQQALQFGPDAEHLAPLQAKLKDGLGAPPGG